MTSLSFPHTIQLSLSLTFSLLLSVIMSSIMSPQGVVLVTAMAVSGTVILLALRQQKSPSITHFPLHSCIISSDEGKKKERKKKKVHFAEDVVDPTGNSDDYRKSKRNYNNIIISKQHPYSKNGGKIPANRMALYKGILRDRVLPNVTYSC